MQTFDLNTFLKSYRPKTLEKELEPYLRCSRLRKYKLLKKNNLDQLVPAKTYIKYVQIDRSFTNTNYKSHIRGGLLLEGGIMRGLNFVKINNKENWTHLMLKFDPTPVDDNSRDDLKRIFCINISNCYVFYRIFGDKRTFLSNCVVELVKSGV